VFRGQKTSRKNKQAGRKALCSSHEATLHIRCERSRKPIDRDLKWRSGGRASIASQALLPTQTPVGPPGSGLHVIEAGGQALFGLKRAKGQIDGLRVQRMKPLTAQARAWPVSPKDRVNSKARSKRLCKRRAFALTGCGLWVERRQSQNR